MPTKPNESVLKSFDILSLVRADRPEITSQIVVHELGMNPATAHRFLSTLVMVGALASYKRGSYCLGPRAAELGSLEQLTNPLSNVVKPVIESASQELNESVMASRLSRGGPVCMAVATPNRPFNIAIKVGTILPLHSTAQGKLWLSSLTRKERLARLGAYRLVALTDRTIQDLDVLEQELDQIRSQGFAINKGENEVDLGAVSIPVKGKTGEIILTLSLFGLLSRFDDQFVARAIERLRRAAEEIQNQSGQ